MNSSSTIRVSPGIGTIYQVQMSTDPPLTITLPTQDVMTRDQGNRVINGEIFICFFLFLIVVLLVGILFRETYPR